MGLFPCDARRSVSGTQHNSPCNFTKGLQETFNGVVDLPITGANISFPITRSQVCGRGCRAARRRGAFPVTTPKKAFRGGGDLI